jgi:hypothetical protein
VEAAVYAVKSTHLLWCRYSRFFELYGATVVVILRCPWLLKVIFVWTA